MSLNEMGARARLQDGMSGRQPRVASETAHLKDSTSGAVDFMATATSAGGEASSTFATMTIEPSAGVAVSDRIEDLGRFDVVTGDRDHGIGMHRSSEAACAISQTLGKDDGQVRSVLRGTGATSADVVAGRREAFLGALLAAPGCRIDTTKEMQSENMVVCLARSLVALVALEHTHRGQRALLDILPLFSQTLPGDPRRASGPSNSWCSTARVAELPAIATAGPVPGAGRTKVYKARSVDVEGTVYCLAFALATMGKALSSFQNTERA